MNTCKTYIPIRIFENTGLNLLPVKYTKNQINVSYSRKKYNEKKIKKNKESEKDTKYTWFIVIFIAIFLILAIMNM